MSDPMDALKQWHDWYDGHRVVAEINEPLVTKDSRENLHDTRNATDVLPNWREFYQELLQPGAMEEESSQQETNVYQQKAQEHFADTIAEFFNEMSGEELYNAFVAAAKRNMDFINAEYDRAKDLMDLLEGKRNAKK